MYIHVCIRLLAAQRKIFKQCRWYYRFLHRFRGLNQLRCHTTYVNGLHMYQNLTDMYIHVCNRVTYVPKSHWHVHMYLDFFQNLYMYGTYIYMYRITLLLRTCQFLPVKITSLLCFYTKKCAGQKKSPQNTVDKSDVKFWHGLKFSPTHMSISDYFRAHSSTIDIRMSIKKHRFQFHRCFLNASPARGDGPLRSW